MARNPILWVLPARGVVSVCPGDHVKTRMQTSSVASAAVGSLPPLLLRVARDILDSHGIAGLYQGLAATVARQCPRLAAYFSLYNTMRSELLPSLRRQSREYEGNVDGAGGRRDQLLASVAAGVLAGALFWAIVHPLDFVKTRVRPLPHDCCECERGMARVGSDIVRQHWWRGLYRGFGRSGN